MILHRVPVYIVLIVCFLTIYGLFTVKDNVMTLRSELNEVKKQLQNEKDALRILKAELAYLGSPERIQKLAYDHLALEKPKVTQMTNDPLSKNLTTEKQLVSSEIIKKPNIWRYKKGPTKYLTMAKGRK